jgi:hypothetical protein
MTYVKVEIGVSGDWQEEEFTAELTGLCGTFDIVSHGGESDSERLMHAVQDLLSKVDPGEDAVIYATFKKTVECDVGTTYVQFEEIEHEAYDMR